MVNKRYSPENAEIVTQQKALIEALSHELTISFADIQKLEPRLFADETDRLIISIVKDLWSNPTIKQPRATDISYELEQALKNNGYSEEDAKKVADRFENLSDRKKAPSVTLVVKALQNFSFDTSSNSGEENDPSSSEAIPNIKNYKAIDIFNPRGDFAVIYDAIRNSAIRPLEDSCILSTLHCCALLSSKYHHSGLNGKKLNLITMIVAISAAGKEHSQNFLLEFAEELALKSHVYNSPRSDKDMIFNLLESQGMTFYIIDEAQRLFNSINSKDAYKQNMGDELLTMATSQTYVLSGKHKREFKEKYAKQHAELMQKIATQEGQISSLDKTKENFQEELSQAEFKLEKLNDAMYLVDWQLDSIDQGVKNPVVNLMMASTPQNLDSLINSATISSGFVGRTLVLRSPEKRMRSQNPVEVDWHDIAHFIHKASQYEGNVVIENNASILLEEIRDRFEEDDLLNHPELGALYARAYERIITIASLLAISSGVIQEYDVMYALALFMRNIEDCYYLLQQNNAAFSSDSDELYSAIKQRVSKLVRDAKGIGITQSTLKQIVMRNKQFQGFEKQQKLKKINVFNEAISQLIMHDIIKKNGARLYIV